MRLNKSLQKAKVLIIKKSDRIKDSSSFAEGEFQRLTRRKLRIPVKLFHL